MSLLKKTIVLIVLTCLIFGLLSSFAVKAAGEISSGSSVGGVLLENLTIEEAKVLLQEKVTEWLTEEVLIAQNEYETLEIHRTAFEFDIDGSLELLEEEMKRTWSSFLLKPKNIQLPFLVEVNESTIKNWPDHIDMEKTMEHARVIASNLKGNLVQIEYKESPATNQEDVAKVSYSLPNISNSVTNHIAQELDGYVIPASDAFSFLDAVELIDGMGNSEEETSFTATALYALVLQTNLEIIERHSQGEIPSYTDAGIEVEVDREEDKDFTIYNPNNQPFTIKAELLENELVMSLQSIPSMSKYSYITENAIEIEPKTIYRYSPDLAYGAEEVLQLGQNGLQIEVYRAEKHKDGSTEREQISRDYYPPIPEIILISTKEEVEQKEIIESEMDSTLHVNDIELNEFLSGIAEEENSDSDTAKDKNIDPEKILLYCMMEENFILSEEQKESTEENTEDEKFPLCDFLLLYMLNNIMEDEQDTNSEEEAELEDSSEEFLENSSLPNKVEKDDSNIEEERMLK
ncbi:hypothetical protein D8M04_00860 [Oceanobacillus piezotolerans]|uniref:G5 domain-containing protein n=1 Tax=Oceanobacillus piezotolerans TaxID=2448030 RepID=A0A498DA61_9BACI|nr:G5 domain-containing protein [Oceanobacillus piezotolerans]RLL47861.1 hypothetical protein D8M04_00860 [Oceanobacillus piezotolerans]